MSGGGRSSHPFGVEMRLLTGHMHTHSQITGMQRGKRRKLLFNPGFLWARWRGRNSRFEKGRKCFPKRPSYPTYGCAVVQHDLVGRQRSLPDHELVEGACHVVLVEAAVARPDDQVWVGVSVVLWDTAADRVSGSEGAIDVDLQTILFGPGEEDVGPEVTWGRRRDVIWWMWSQLDRQKPQGSLSETPIGKFKEWFKQHYILQCSHPISNRQASKIIKSHKIIFRNITLIYF